MYNITHFLNFMMDYFYNFMITGLVQTLTEFLPISSSSHLSLLIQFYPQFGNQPIVFINLSNAISLIITLSLYYQWKHQFYPLNFKQLQPYFIALLLLSLPVLIIGFIVDKYLNLNESIRLSYTYMSGYNHIIFGFLFIIAHFVQPRKQLSDNRWKDFSILGLVQILALMPGVSRLGIITLTAKYLGYSQRESIYIGFLSAIPILTIAGGYDILKLMTQTEPLLSGLDIIGLTFLFTLIGLIWLRQLIPFLNNLQYYFIIIGGYRIILGIIFLFI